jgi:HK97 family phage portal protein
MSLFPRRKAETRAGIEDPTVPVSSPAILEFFGLDEFSGASDIPVTVETALQVPAIWSAVNFLSSEIAMLPMHLYRRTKTGPQKIESPLAVMLHDCVNDDLLTSFQWRKSVFEAVLTGGRHVTFIEKAASGRVMNFWPLDPNGVTVKKREGRKFYSYRDGGRTVEYEPSEVLDFAFMLKNDGLRHFVPYRQMRDTIALAIASTRYGTKFFSNGGVPPFVIEGGFKSARALQQAADDMDAAVKKASKEKRLALTLPTGLTVKSLGVDPDKSKYVELQGFLIVQAARMYQMPPVFIQDLSHGTMANTEQQDLQLVKHTLMRWIVQVEQELNVKLFGRSNNRTYVKLNADGVMRGDFLARMQGYGQAVQNGIMKPNEARAREELDAAEGGDRLMIQGATVPLVSAGVKPIDPAQASQGDPTDTGAADPSTQGDPNEG